MKKSHQALLSLFVSLSSFLALAACGDDSGTGGKSDAGNVSLQVESSDDLPNCSKNREGDIAEVLGERKAYVCDNGRWEVDHDILDSVKTEDDLSACLSKNESDSVWVTNESAIFVCTDRKWEKREKESSADIESIPTYKSEDKLPNCTKDRNGNLALVDSEVRLCVDGKWNNVGEAYSSSDEMPNCTSKRDGNTAFVVEDRQAFVCTDGKWKENESVEKEVKPTAKSSSSKSSSSMSDKGSDGKSSAKAVNSSSAKSDKAGSSSGKADAASSSSGKAVSSSSGKSVSSSSGKVVASSSAKTDKVSSSSKADTPKSSSAKAEVKATGSMKDSRDGKTYKTVRIGNQVWFAENLNYDDGHGLCPMREKENCAKYGRLYNFESGSEAGASSILSLCPEGWHIPDSLEFVELISYVSRSNGGEPVGVSLKATTGWYAVGDTVTIPGDGYASMGSIDSTRIAAALGTDRFGFAALPAGSCWDNGGCYVGDDTRFFFMSADFYGGGYKLAFDKDEFMYDESAKFGSISVRCLQNQDVKIDAMPSTIVVDSLMWMAEDLTTGGNSEFSLHEALAACPKGWRLPTTNEFISAGGEWEKLSFVEKTEYFAADNQYHVTYTCGSLGCSWSTGNSQKALKHVRCVNEGKLKAVSGCACSASKLDSNHTVTWTVSGCKEGDYKVSGYSWDFGEGSEDVTTSGAKAYKKFNTFEIVTPSVAVNSSVSVDGKSYSVAQMLTCPSVRAGVSDSTIVFSDKINVKLHAGRKYTAMLEGKCDKANLSCTFDDQDDESKKASIKVGVHEFEGSGSIEGSVKTVCNGVTFTVKASDDMECYISY